MPAREAATMSESAVEGWYPDPDVAGALRWWDGTTWTDHHREWSDDERDEADVDDEVEAGEPDDDVAAGADDVDDDAADEPTDEPVTDRRRRWIGLGVVVALAAALTWIVASRGGDGPGAERTPTSGRDRAATISTAPPGTAGGSWEEVDGPSAPSGERFRVRGAEMVVPSHWRPTEVAGHDAAWFVIDASGTELGRVTLQVVRSPETIEPAAAAEAVAVAPEPQMTLIGNSTNRVRFAAPTGDGAAWRVDYRAASVLGGEVDGRAWSRVAGGGSGGTATVQTIVRLIAPPDRFAAAATACESVCASAQPRAR